jgi:hypothetical protein
MSLLIGGSAPYSTWAKLRTVFAINNVYEGSVGGFNAYYQSGLRSDSEGSGLIRTKNYGFTYNLFGHRPNFRKAFVEPGYYIWISGGPNWPLDVSVTQEVVEELTGETMTFASGSVVLNSTFFSYGGYGQSGESPSNVGAIETVSKLKPVD